MNMRKLITIPLLLASVCAGAQFRTPGYAELNQSETVSEMREHVRYLSSAALEGRAAGSEGENDAAVYFGSVLEGYGLDVLSGKEGELFGMALESGDTLRSHNVIAYIPGYDRELKNHYIVIGARLDNLGTTVVNVDGQPVTRTYYGANGNASGLAALAQLARRLNTNSALLKRSVIIAAFGSSLRDNAGSWYFLNRSFPDAGMIDAMVNLDMLGTGSNGFYAYTSSNADLNGIISGLSSTLQPVHPLVVSKEPCASDHRSFYAAEIPSVFFTTGMYPEYNSVRDTESILEYDWLEREVEYIYNFTVELCNGNAPDFSPSVVPGRKNASDDKVVSFFDCDVRPSFLGSTDPQQFLKKWVYVYLKYPREAVSNGIQGRVMVDFIIDEKGKVRDVKVLKGADPLLDEEAVRVIEASPDWKPGKVGGKKVKCEMTVSVEFKLEKKK